MGFILISLTTVLFTLHVASAATVCGDDPQKKEYQQATDEIIRRLMGMRKPNWAWESLSAPIVLQVTVPERFFGRSKTATAVETLISAGVDKMTIRQKAVSAIALTSLCLNASNINGYDLVKDISEHLSTQFPDNRRTPVEGYNMYSIGIGALCCTNYSIDPDLVHKFLRGQNADGSFGDDDKLARTIGLVPPIHCLSTMTGQAFNVTAVDEAVAKMREYIISNKATTEAGEVYIGDEYWSSHALISLWVSRKEGEDTARWHCRAILMTLGLYPNPGESESMLLQRLLRIYGAGYLNVALPGYQCIEPDDIPHGYVPTCDHDEPGTCEPKTPPK